MISVCVNDHMKEKEMEGVYGIGNWRGGLN